MPALQARRPAVACPRVYPHAAGGRRAPYICGAGRAQEGRGRRPACSLACPHRMPEPPAGEPLADRAAIAGRRRRLRGAPKPAQDQGAALARQGIARLEAESLVKGREGLFVAIKMVQRLAAPRMPAGALWIQQYSLVKGREGLVRRAPAQRLCSPVEGPAVCAAMPSRTGHMGRRRARNLCRAGRRAPFDRARPDPLGILPSLPPSLLQPPLPAAAAHWCRADGPIRMRHARALPALPGGAALEYRPADILKD